MRQTTIYAIQGLRKATLRADVGPRIATVAKLVKAAKRIRGCQVPCKRHFDGLRQLSKLVCGERLLFEEFALVFGGSAAHKVALSFHPNSNTGCEDEKQVIQTYSTSGRAEIRQIFPAWRSNSSTLQAFRDNFAAIAGVILLLGVNRLRRVPIRDGVVWKRLYQTARLFRCNLHPTDTWN